MLSSELETNIRNYAESQANVIFKAFTETKKEYVKFQSEIIKKNYVSYEWDEWDEHIADNAQLAELALALEELGNAYSAMNTARCITR